MGWRPRLLASTRRESSRASSHPRRSTHRRTSTPCTHRETSPRRRRRHRWQPYPRPSSSWLREPPTRRRRWRAGTPRWSSSVPPGRSRTRRANRTRARRTPCRTFPSPPGTPRRVPWPCRRIARLDPGRRMPSSASTRRRRERRPSASRERPRVGSCESVRPSSRTGSVTSATRVSSAHQERRTRDETVVG